MSGGHCTHPTGGLQFVSNTKNLPDAFRGQVVEFSALRIIVGTLPPWYLHPLDHLWDTLRFWTSPYRFQLWFVSITLSSSEPA